MGLLSNIQIEILVGLVQYILKKGYPPYESELARICETSRQNIRYHRKKLIENNYLLYDNKKVELTDKSIRSLKEIGRWPLPISQSKTFFPPPLPSYIAHPYPLQENFTGRDRERKLLCEWFEQGETPMLALLAIGGMGKSSLAWYWLQEDILKQNKAPKGVIWWSFYEKDSGFESFVNKSLEYAGGGKINPQEMPLRERMDSLYQILQQKRFLLILDGVERLLRHYVRLDAPYLSDDKPGGDDQKFRTCADPHVCTFLQDLANNYTKTRTLITSRLFPLELEGMDGCQREDLTEFSLNDTHKFFERQGLKWTRAEVNQVCQPYGFLPLSLRLLTGVILHDPLEPGEMHPNPKRMISKLTHELDPKKHHVLEVAYDSLSPEQQEFLSRISAFRSPMDKKAIFAVSAIQDKETIKGMLLSLIGRGLLLVDGEKFDLHPIVRAYSYERLRDKEGTHARLRDYFDAAPKPAEIKSLADLTPVIELYHHTLRAGDYDKAKDLLETRLIPNPLYYTFGAYQLCIELLLGLFPDGEDKLPRLKSKSAQAWTLNALAVSYSMSGQPRHSVPVLSSAMKIADDLGNKKNLAAGLGNLAIDQMALGELADAQANLQRSIHICREIDDRFRKAVGYQELGRLLAYRGDWPGADGELKTALGMFEGREHRQGIGITWVYRSLAALLQGDYAQAMKAAQEARRLADVEHFERDIIRAEWLLGAAYRGLTDLPQAEKHIHEALSRCRRINLVEHEADILLELARVRRLQKHSDETMNLAHDALKIADRCEYRLQQADIHLFLAQLALDGGDKSKARTEAGIAKERAGCGYKPTLEKAERFLKEL